jgi:hypothetical protein
MGRVNWCLARNHIDLWWLHSAAHCNNSRASELQIAETVVVHGATRLFNQAHYLALLLHIPAFVFIWGPPSLLLSIEYLEIFPWDYSGRGVRLTTQSSTEVNNLCVSTSPYGFMVQCLIKQWYNLPFNRLCVIVVRVPGYGSRGHGFESRRCQIFWEVVCLERGSLSLVRITEEPLEWKSSGSGLENRD